MAIEGLKDRKTNRRQLADVVRISRAEADRKDPLRAVGSDAPPAKSQAICIASGKGGTGKTIFSINIGVLLAREGYRVALVDADLGLANSHLLLDLEPTHDVSQLISGERSIDEVLIEGPHGLRILPGGSGIAELAELEESQLGYFARQMMKLEEDTDITLVDCSAGITSQVLRFLASAHHIVVVTTPEVTSMIDGYAVIKNVHRLRPDMQVLLVVNRIREEAESNEVFNKMRDVVKRRLGHVNMTLLGAIPHDRYVLRSIALRQPVIGIHPRCFATSCFTQMARRIENVHRHWRKAQEGMDQPAPSYFWSLAGRYHD